MRGRFKKGVGLERLKWDNSNAGGSLKHLQSIFWGGGGANHEPQGYGIGESVSQTVGGGLRPDARVINIKGVGNRQFVDWGKRGVSTRGCER